MNAELTAMRESPGTERVPTWAERNQQWLVRELAHLSERIQSRYTPVDGSSSPAQVSSPRAIDTNDDGSGFVPALDRIASLFGLTRFEREVLLLTAGVELDANLRRAVSTATGGSKRPNFGVALDVLTQPHWDAMSPQSPLRYWRLIALDPGTTLTELGLRIDERVLHELTGVAAFDERLQGIAWPARRDQRAYAVDPPFASRLSRALSDEAAQPVLLVLSAHPGDSYDAVLCEALTVVALAGAGFNAICTDVRDLPADPREFSETSRALDREAALTTSTVIVKLDVLSEHTHEHETRAAALVSQLRSHVVLIGRPSRELLAALQQRRIHHLTTPRVSSSAASTPMPSALERALRRASQQFRVTPGQVDSALASIDLPLDSDASADARTDAVVWHALRETARGGLETLAQRIESRTTFADVVLPPLQLAMLRDITRHLRHRDRVYNEWGLGAVSSRGLGLAALFTGESGTGKTMAAEAIANEAQLDLYRIDLASVVSKYIGETEKNLKRLFDAAEVSGAVLLFDEADALFGKRSDVRDSHDRYANIEIAYLLQRIDAYRGLAVLTTNMKSTLDRAFLRRIRFVVQFPFPDAHARERIWRMQFPPAAPVGAVDFAALARMQMAGGNIRSIAVNAAFRAADNEGCIDQGVLLAAAQSEYAKLDRNPSDLGGAT